ncbi:unnamed protein product [Ilex paraguariensis]|uniref:Uncharacterized protein n=1 Tax=Ilex paraguariensis TaxID=185542 RepID=A0ABC8TNS0_9AQUA
MVSNSLFQLVLFFILAGLCSSTYISYDAFESRGPTSRNLLQQKADEAFESRGPTSRNLLQQKAGRFQAPL